MKKFICFLLCCAFASLSLNAENVKCDFWSILKDYTDSLEEAKAFKTKATIQKLTTMVNLEAIRNPEFVNNLQSWPSIVKANPLIKNFDSYLKDGWGEEFQVTLKDDQIHVTSMQYENYKLKHPTPALHGPFVE